MAAKEDKSLLTAYICWVVGGLFGLHHFYLGRDAHAFITLSTFGGYFTLGLLRDLWRLPEYVKDANNDLTYVDWLHSQIKTHPRPPSGIARQSGLLMVGNLFACLIEFAIPEELLNQWVVMLLKLLLIPLFSTLGVWLVGNVGRHQGSIKKPLIASYLAIIPSIFYNISPRSFTTLAAIFVFNRNREWRIKKDRPKKLITRSIVFITCVAIYLSLWSSWLYFGCTIEDPETLKHIKCRVALSNFIKSPAYINLSEALWMLYEHVKHNGIMSLWREIMQEFDVSGKNSALHTLDLDENATPQEILAQYKKLSRENHPDKEKIQSKKAGRQERFIEIQEAFRTLQPVVQRHNMRKSRAFSDEEVNSKSHDEL